MPASERILSPDVNRGFMLLFIAIANITTAWAMFGMRRESTALDVGVGMFNAMFVHQRSLPMFAALLGYGIGMIMAREAGKGTPFEDFKKLLFRRYGWLAAIGVVHCTFLFFGDILIPYGIMGLFIALLFLRVKERSAVIFFWVMFGLLLLGAVLATVGEILLRRAYPDVLGGGDLFELWARFGNFGDSYLVFLGMGAMAALSNVFGGFVGLFLMLGPVMLLGFVAGRAQILSNVDQHAGLLRRVAVWGFTISILGGALAGAKSLGLLGEPWLFGPMLLSYATGMPGGLAAVALVALLLRPLQAKVHAAAAAGEPARLPLLIDMLQALGKRSLSGYLFQSVAFLILLPPFTLGLMPRLGVATGSLLAVAVWAISLVGAWVLERAGRQGPAEALHRRLTYGPKAAR